VGLVHHAIGNGYCALIHGGLLNQVPVRTGC
jgi:hypothetical protein